jgi:hypothetical protein
VIIDSQAEPMVLREIQNNSTEVSPNKSPMKLNFMSEESIDLEAKMSAPPEAYKP